MAFSLPMSDIQSLYDDVAGEMLNQFGVSSEIFYPPTKSECTNCVFVAFGNTSGSNVYNGTGPESFSFGNCPVCEGKGFKDIEAATDTIKLRFYNNKRDWKKIGESIVIPDAEAMVIGSIGDLPKLLRMNKVKINTTIANYKTYFFVLASEPYKHGFGNAFFSCYLKRSS